jgi:hypothetical protein
VTGGGRHRGDRLGAAGSGGRRGRSHGVGGYPPACRAGAARAQALADRAVALLFYFATIAGLSPGLEDERPTDEAGATEN